MTKKTGWKMAGITGREEYCANMLLARLINPQVDVFAVSVGAVLSDFTVSEFGFEWQ